MFLTDHELPLGEQTVGFVGWLTPHGASFFDKVSDTLEFLIHGAINGLLWSDSLVLIALLIELVHFIQRSWGLTVFALASLLLILNLGYWQETMETLARVIFVTLVYITVGVPLGIVTAYKPWFYTTLRSLLDLMQVAPIFAYLIPALALFGLGVVPGLISAVIFAVAASVRLTYLDIQDVPAELLDAGKASNCSRWQLLTCIELPHVMPGIVADITQCIILPLLMVVIAALVGIDDPGKPVVSVLNTAGIPFSFKAGLAIVLLTVLLNRVYKQYAVRGKQAMTAIRFDRADVTFGTYIKEALELLNQGLGRVKILKRTGRVFGVEDVCLDINRGKIYVLMGLSGFDKSSLLHCINGLNKISRGKLLIEYEGSQMDIANCLPATLRAMRIKRTTMVFQKFALVPWLMVAENVGFGLEIRNRPAVEQRKPIDGKLGLVGLSQWHDRRPDSLFDDVQQRVGLVRVLTMDGNILLVDEPSSALDPLIHQQLQGELLVLQRRLHKTIVLADHDLDEVLKIDTRIVIMKDGRIIQHGKPEEVVLSPADDYVRISVTHTGPLNMLCGQDLMRDLDQHIRQNDEIYFNQDRGCRIGLNEGDMLRGARQGSNIIGLQR